ncbi:MAG: hypothetical protein VW907_10680 [Opitutae bacterium]
MSKGVFTRTESGSLIGTEPNSWTILARLKLGEMVTCEIKNILSPEQYRMFFALVDTIFENQERYVTKELLKDAVKINAGHYVEQQFPKESAMFKARVAETMVLFGLTEITPYQVERLREIWTQLRPKSVAWAALTHEEFQPIFDSAVEIGHKLLGVDPVDLMNEAHEA